MKNENHAIKKLTRKQFADALQKGLGRARLHATHYGIDEVNNLILKACLHDQASDPQSENSKAAYLFAMFQNTRYLPDFKAAILKSLKTKRDTWDVQLLFEMALQIALSGDSDARLGIRERAIRKAKKRSEDDWLGAEEWITLAGTEGAIELAKIYGSRLMKNAEDYVPEDEIFPNEEIKNEFRERLFEESLRNPPLEAYWNYLDRRKVFEPRTGPFTSTREIHERHKQEIRKQYSLDSILKDAKNKVDKYRFSRFGWAATADELQEIYEALLHETDNEVIHRLLRVFSRVPPPGLDDKLFHWANSNNSNVRWASIRVLSQRADERVHELARKKIQISKLVGADSSSIELFVNNYQPDDAKLITRALRRARPNKEDAHSLAWDVIDLCKKYHDPGLRDALMWSYEKTPCSDCRFRIVEQLDSIGQLSSEILYESQFDGNGDIVEFAHKKMSH